MKHAKKLTIAIPTYNRPEHLKRLLHFLVQEVEGVSFVIGDSSTSKNKNINKEMIQSLNNKLIRYFEYDESLATYNKFALLFKEVQTPYTVFCSDDDFLVPSSLDICVDFLLNNSSYSQAKGKFYVFYQKENLEIKWLPCHHQAVSVEGATAQERLEKVQLDDLEPFVGVWKTEILQLKTDETAKTFSGVGFSVFTDMLYETLSFIYGNVKVLDIPFYFQQCHTQTASKGVSQRFEASLLTEELHNHKSMFFLKIAFHLQNYESISRQEAFITIQNLVDRFMIAHIKIYNAEKLSGENITKSKKENFILYIKKNLPLPAVLFIQFMKQKIMPTHPLVALVNKYNFWMNNKNSNYYKEFERIKACVRRSKIYSINYNEKGMMWASTD